ncbi:MAG: hypothetical protein K2M43_02950 [Mycoplasmoidaceae bacterium]|nr:hypothetical protein [Mycoplasmoidaceae bacterium]
MLPGDGAPLLSVSDSTISKLYQAFSGFADGDDYSSTYPKLSDFINTQDKEYEYVKKYQDILSNTKLIPYVRTGGSLTSGTAASFYDYSRFTDAHKDLDPRTENAFAVGNYGSD